MNCEKCQDLISDFLDGALSHEDQSTLSAHLEECLHCAAVRDDVQSIVGFCRAHRGEYTAPPNEQALWLRIRNMIEAGASPDVAPAPATGKQARSKFWTNWTGRSWELSFPQLVASAAAIVLVVSLSTFVGLRRFQSGRFGTSQPSIVDAGANLAIVREGVSQQEQMISYWNERVEFNKTRWSPQMRETFDRNLKVIDQAVNDSFDALSQNPNDDFSKEMLNSALNEKLSLLKEFAAL
jgi:hypothetical protein